MVPGAEVDACGLFRMLWKMIKFYIKWVKLIGNTNDKKKRRKKYSELQESYQERNSLSKGGQKIGRCVLSAAYRPKATLLFYISILINLLNIHHSGLQ